MPSGMWSTVSQGRAESRRGLLCTHGPHGTPSPGIKGEMFCKNGGIIEQKEKKMESGEERKRAPSLDDETPWPSL